MDARLINAVLTRLAQNAIIYRKKAIVLLWNKCLETLIDAGDGAVMFFQPVALPGAFYSP